jgi:hypothetical protein
MLAFTLTAASLAALLSTGLIFYTHYIDESRQLHD